MTRAGGGLTLRIGGADEQSVAQTRESVRLMHGVVLAHEVDWEGWRVATRALVLAGVPAEAIAWSVRAMDDPTAESEAFPPASGTFNVPRALVELAGTAIQARDPERFALLYGLVLRAHQGERYVLQNVGDASVSRLIRLVQAVRRDTHRMRAFLRFRTVEQDGAACSIGWFEPGHYILEANAGFLARRSGKARWSVLTPYRAVHWDGQALAFSPGVDPSAVPDDDALERCWRTHFSFVLAPGGQHARATDRMPIAHWRNLPGPAAIPDLPEQDMRTSAKPPNEPMRARPDATAPGKPLAEAAREAETCRNCALWESATQTVFGEGPVGAALMMVGEQPGDQEDLVGRPFVGPAGQLLDRAMDEAGIDRRAVYVTNAVKHFKFIPRGKRRIHQKPETAEIVACTPWLDIERAAVRPRLLVLLGATAARAVLGRAVTITRERGERITLEDGQAAFVTVHPSYLLRLPDDESKAREYRAFVADLRKAARLAAE